MKYKVISSFIRRSENNKQYNIGDTVELGIEQATQMLKEGFIQVIDELPTKTASEKMTEFKTKTTKKAK